MAGQFGQGSTGINQPLVLAATDMQRRWGDNVTAIGPDVQTGTKFASTVTNIADTGRPFEVKMLAATGPSGCRLRQGPQALEGFVAAMTIIDIQHDQT